MKRWTVCMLVTQALSAAAWGQATAPVGEDYWVEPMKQVHAKFSGQRGSVAQFGDSITITMAFFTPLESGEVRNLTPEMKQALEWLRGYVQRRCWRAWKGPGWGNEGRTTTEWGLSNMDGWLKKMDPEIALIMWGTNDTYLGPHPPKYTENLRQIVQKCLDNGTIPILYTIPPVGDQTGDQKKTQHVETFVQAAREVAREKKVPLVDFYQEMLKRQPTDFAKTLLGDNLHPSFPQEYQNDFGDTALKNSGYTLRNYLTLKGLWQVNQQVLTKVTPKYSRASASVFNGPTYKGLPAVRVAKVDPPPVVDGRLTDEAWKKAQVLEFRLLDGDARKPEFPTEARVVSTDKALYVSFRCQDNDLLTLVSSKRPRDTNVWEDDSVEVFLLPEEKPSDKYYQVIVNPDGSMSDSLARDPKAWDGTGKVAVARQQDAWCVEVEILLADLKLPEDKARLAGPWRLNLNRSRPARGEYAEETALSPTEDPSSHVPNMFAYAFLEVFGGKLPPQPATQTRPAE